MTKDVAGYNGFGLVFTDTAYSATLAINTDTTLTIPSKSGLGSAAFYDKAPINFVQQNGQPLILAIFTHTPGSEVWVANNTTAAVPAGASFAATVSEMNPAARLVKGGDVLHFFCAAANTSVSVLLYWLT